MSRSAELHLVGLEVRCGIESEKEEERKKGREEEAREREREEEKESDGKRGAI